MTTIDQAAATYFATLPSIPSDSTRQAFRAGFEAHADFKQATDQGGWFSVADRLPEHEQTVLCHGAASREPWTSIACFHRDGSFYDPEIGDELYPPTHWQPLPAAPTLLGVADGDAVGGKSGGAA